MPRVSNPFKTKKFCTEVAKAISENTGIDYSFNCNDYGSLIYDFGIGNSYMTNNGGNGLYFALVNNNCVTISEISSIDANDFIQRVSSLVLSNKL